MGPVLRKIAEQVQEARAAAAAPRATSSEKRRRENEKDIQARRYVSGVSLLAFFVVLAVGVAATVATMSPWPGLVGALAGVFLMFSLKVANQWERAVVLRFGKFQGLKGPGLFVLIPIVDEITQLVDQRVRVTDVSAESALTKDTVPVNVDAIVFWTVWDAQKSVLEVADYLDAVSLSAQTALRETIGRHQLAEMITEREQLGKQLQTILDEKTNPWGITVQSVEIRDVRIPADLEDAMSRQAQAERERQARVILGESEKQIAASFAEASLSYADNPTALHLRAMNMLFEGLKQKGALVIVPSSAVETMNLGGLSGMVSLAQNNLPKESK
jgi:regulator of protease activity HflC (stomatin/prohibitin superfamily)